MRTIRSEANLAEQLMQGHKSAALKRERPLLHRPPRRLGDLCKLMVAVALWAIALDMWGVI